MADNTAPKQLVPYNFKAGQSGNPKGRPKGSRNKIQESFLRDFFEAWETFGRMALVMTACQNPDKFVQVAAGLLPKEVKITEMTDDELRDHIRELAAECGLAIGEVLRGTEAPASEDAVRH